MPPVGFEPTISAGERPQTYALDRAAVGPTNTDNSMVKCVVSVDTMMENGNTVFCSWLPAWLLCVNR